MIDTRLLARLLATARTVTALGAVPTAPKVGDEHSELVRAQVAARLADGTFRLLVDGRSIKAALPGDVKPGDVVELRVVNRGAGAQGDAAGARSESGALSNAGRLISALLSGAAAAPPRQAHPILPLPPTTPADLPEPLARALERSGMFYESHQARWVDGEYPLQRLLQEPQAALAAAGSAAPAEGEADAVRMPVPFLAASLADADTVAEGASSTSQQSTPARPADESHAQLVARDALALVRNQLETLDSRHITWLGEIWPGQPLRWEIEADDPDRHEPGHERGWNTRFSLELPTLGEIGADMALAAGGVRVNLAAKTPEAAALMRAAAAELTQALIAAGVAPVHLKLS
ncbi:MAG: hypothetical protein GEV05_25600 [Betaproteobacteria bacterium]|nr:hypothetical protein [Betaproteobacteria bacterium]